MNDTFNQQATIAEHSTSISLPTAKQAMAKLALAEAEKATNAERLRAASEAEKKALIDRLMDTSQMADEEIVKRAAIVIQRAIENGQTEVEVIRFPNILCTDRGRAINQQERGWEETLTGVPKELVEFWRKHLQPKGYKVKAEVVEFPDGVPGDIGLKLKWA